MAPQALDAAAIRRVIGCFRDGLRAHRQVIDNLNVYPVPDGDTGANMSATMDSVADGLDGVEAEIKAYCKAIAHGALMGARGNSGVILAQIMRGLSSTLSEAANDGSLLGPEVFARALSAASAGAYGAVARPVEGTILTVVREASEAATDAADTGASLLEVLEAARERGYDALERTPEMLAVLAEANVVDAGGAGLMLLFDACLSVVDGRAMPEPPEAPPPPASMQVTAGHGHGQATAADHGTDGDREASIADLRYEVMFLLDAPDAAIEGFKQAWSRIGDSIVVVGGDGLWNCHIHSDDIGASIEAAIDVGRPHRIQVTDLLDQAAEHSDAFSHTQSATQSQSDLSPGAPHHKADKAPDHSAQANEQAADVGDGPVEITEAEACAVVAVGAGAGVHALFESMGVARVVSGGQSMNPSTAELLAAVDSLPTGHVMVLPNNKNIIAVANQVDGESERTVRVVPTRSVVGGIASLLAFSGAATAEQNLQAMSDAATEVIALELTQAVRPASSSAGPIRTGDWLGIGPEGIAVITQEPQPAATALLDSFMTDDHELLTVIEGEGASAAITSAIEAHIDECHSHVEVEVTSGGQPLYPYLFGLE